MKSLLPDDAKKELAAIFTKEYLPAVEKACQRYLRGVKAEKPSILEDGRTLLLLCEKAVELKTLLSKKTAISRMTPHLPGGAMVVHELKKALHTLCLACECTPATEQAKKPKRGRPKGSYEESERALAFHLFEIYRQAHNGALPARTVSRESKSTKGGTETGPLPRAAAILGSTLGLGSNFARHFRSIEKLQKELMDKK